MDSRHGVTLVPNVQQWRPSKARPGTFRRVPAIVHAPGGWARDLDALMTTAEVAEMYGVTTRRVQAMIASDQLRAMRYGHIWLIRYQDACMHVERKPGRPPLVMKRESFDLADDYYWDDDY